MTRMFRHAAGHHKGCPQCGGLLQYDISARLLKCSSCSAETDLDWYIQDEPQDAAAEMDVVEYSCPQCGAAVHTTQTNMVSYCNFCGSNVLFRERYTTARRPDKIVPFRVTRERCENIFRQHMAHSPYAPRSARDAASDARFLPVYVPFYVYREVYEGPSTGRYTRQQYMANEVITEEYQADLESRVEVYGEAQCATSLLEDDTAERLKLCIDDAVPFNPAYLCGFYAESPDMDDGRLESSLAPYAAEVYRMKTSVNFQSLSMPKKQEDAVDVMLLPVWLLAESRGERVAYTAINGLDGTIVCDTPVEPRKTFALAATLALVFTLLLLMLNSVVILRAKLATGLCALLAAAGYYVINHALNKHLEQEQRLCEQRRLKRCKPLDTGTLRKSRSESGIKVEYKLVGYTLAVTACLVCLILTATTVPVPVFLLIEGGLLLVSVTKLCKLYQERTANRVMRHTLTEWLLVYGGKFLAVGLGIGVLMSSGKHANEIVGLLVSDTGFLAPYLCACSLVSLLLNRVRHDVAKPDAALYGLTVLLTLAALVLSPFCHVRWAFYLLAALIMGVLILSMLRLTRKHNDYVTRPVPNLFGRGMRT